MPGKAAITVELFFFFICPFRGHNRPVLEKDEKACQHQI
jgi:hypothetical protein